MKRLISIMLIALLILCSCIKSDDEGDIALPNSDTSESAGDLSQEDTQQEPEKDENSQTDQKPEKEQSTQAEQQPETNASDMDKTANEETPKEDNTDKPTVELPECALTLIKNNVGYASDEESAKELRKILEKGDYTEDYSEYADNIRVYFDGKSECVYTIVECKPMQSVRVRSKKGEYMADVDTSLRISELIKQICGYSNELERKGITDLSVYATPDFAQKESHEYITDQYDKNRVITRSAFKSKNLTKLLNQAVYDTSRADSGIGLYPEISVIIKQANGLYITGDLNCDRPFLTKGDKFAFLSNKLAKDILNEISSHGIEKSPVNIIYWPDIFQTSEYSFAGPDSKALKKLLGELSYDLPACHCEATIDVDFTDIENEVENRFSSDYAIVFERDSDNIHVKKGDKMSKLTTKQRDTLTDIMLRQLNSANSDVGSNIDYLSDFNRLEMTVTKDGKTVSPDKEVLTTLGHIFTIVGYAGKECECGEKYAVINTTEGNYSFCTCDKPRIASACGTRRIDTNTLERLVDVIDSLFK